MSLFANFYASVCYNFFPSLVASLSSWRCLAASPVYLLPSPRPRTSAHPPRSVSRPHRIPSARRLGHWVSLFAKFYASVCYNFFPSLVAFLSSWRCLAASTVYLLPSPRPRTSAHPPRPSQPTPQPSLQCPAMPRSYLIKGSTLLLTVLRLP